MNLCCALYRKQSFQCIQNRKKKKTDNSVQKFLSEKINHHTFQINHKKGMNLQQDTQGKSSEKQDIWAQREKLNIITFKRQLSRGMSKQLVNNNWRDPDVRNCMYEEQSAMKDDKQVSMKT